LTGGGSDGPPPIDAREDQPDARPDASPPDARPDAPPPDAPPDAASPDAAPDACVPVVQQVLVNPALDLSPQGMGWTEARDANVIANFGNIPMILPPPGGVAAHSAPHVSWFGGASGEDLTPQQQTIIDQLHQDLTFAADATTFVVSGQILIGTNELPTEVTAFDRLTIDVVETDGTLIETVFTASNLTIADVYTPFTATLAANLAGRTVRLRAVATNDVTLHTNFFVDSLSFTASFCPP
jgi:hypothetical protein